MRKYGSKKTIPTNGEILSYVRKLTGRSAGRSDVGTSPWGASQRKAPGVPMALPKLQTPGETSAPHALPRQLQASTYRTASRSASRGTSSDGTGWIASPVLSTLRSLFGLFSSEQSQTRTRVAARPAFRIEESISPVENAGFGSRDREGLSSTANGIAGGGSQAPVPGARSSTGFVFHQSSSHLDGRTLLGTLRRSLNDSRGLADILTEFQDGL